MVSPRYARLRGSRYRASMRSAVSPLTTLALGSDPCTVLAGLAERTPKPVAAVVGPRPPAGTSGGRVGRRPWRGGPGDGPLWGGSLWGGSTRRRRATPISWPRPGAGSLSRRCSGASHKDTGAASAPVAQRIEHLTTDQKVRGSNPFGRALLVETTPQVTAPRRPHGRGCLLLRAPATVATPPTFVGVVLTSMPRVEKGPGRRPQSAKRQPRFEQPMLTIHQRPFLPEDRSEAGHGEGDLIIGKRQWSPIGTLVERKTGLVRLLHLPRRDGDTLHDALEDRIGDLSARLLRSITWDQARRWPVT